MHKEWIDRWHEGRIGFHQPKVNEYLAKYVSEFDVVEAPSIFVPLCGKSSDMLFLAKQGYTVTGVELVQKAIEEFQSENTIKAKSVTTIGAHTKYEFSNLAIWQGDIFELANTDLKQGKTHIYDRAALIALPPELRGKYAQKMIEILDGVMLLVTLEYPEGTRKGPPFSVSEEEVFALFGSDCTIAVLEGNDLPTETSTCEKVYLLRKKTS